MQKCVDLIDSIMKTTSINFAYQVNKQSFVFLKKMCILRPCWPKLPHFPFFNQKYISEDFFWLRKCSQNLLDNTCANELEKFLWWWHHPLVLALVDNHRYWNWQVVWFTEEESVSSRSRSTVEGLEAARRRQRKVLWETPPSKSSSSSRCHKDTSSCVRSDRILHTIQKLTFSLTVAPNNKRLLDSNNFF